MINNPIKMKSFLSFQLQRMELSHLRIFSFLIKHIFYFSSTGGGTVDEWKR